MQAFKGGYILRLKIYFLYFISFLFVFLLCGCSSKVEDINNLENIDEVQEIENSENSENVLSDGFDATINGDVVYQSDSNNNDMDMVNSDYVQIDSEGNTEIANPITMYNTLDEVEEATGISFSESSDIIDTYSTVILGASGDYPFISLIVLSDIGDLTIRKADGSGDLSGVYIEYEEEWVENKNGLRLNFKGNTKENVSLVWWNNGEYSYSIYVEDDLGVSKDALMNFFDEFFQL